MATASKTDPSMSFYHQVQALRLKGYVPQSPTELSFLLWFSICAEYKVMLSNLSGTILESNLRKYAGVLLTPSKRKWVVLCAT